MDITAGQFWSWDRPRQQEFLRAATAREAEAVGVAAICGSCGQPIPPGPDSHQCDPAHLAEELARLCAAQRPPKPDPGR